jgi:hypothetical protein
MKRPYDIRLVDLLPLLLLRALCPLAGSSTHQMLRAVGGAMKGTR